MFVIVLCDLETQSLFAIVLREPSGPVHSNYLLLVCHPVDDALTGIVLGATICLHGFEGPSDKISPRSCLKGGSVSHGGPILLETNSVRVLGFDSQESL